jgi:hypothetical protein
MWDLALASARKTSQSSQYSAFFLMVGSLIQNTIEPHGVNSCLCDVFDSLKNVTDICIRHHFHDRDEPLLRPILFCLSKAIPLMETKKIHEVFWMTVLLLLFFPTSYLSGPIMLVHATVVELLSRIQQEGDALGSGNAGRDLEEELLESRHADKSLNKYFKRLERGKQSIIGVSFESSFSTAMSCLLLRGLQMTESKTRDLSETTLRLLMEHYQSHGDGGGEEAPARCISGYSVVLLSVWGDISLVSQPQPVMDSQLAIDRRFSTSPVPSSTMSAQGHRRVLITSKARSVVAMSTLPDEAVYRPALQRQRASSTSGLMLEKSLPIAPVSFFGEHNFPTNKSLVLFATMILACIRTLQNMEEEQLFVHTLLLQTIRELPTVLSVLYEVLFSEMSSAYAASRNKEGDLNKAILDILNECLMSGFSRQQGKVRSAPAVTTGPQSGAVLPPQPPTGSEMDDIPNFRPAITSEMSGTDSDRVSVSNPEGHTALPGTAGSVKRTTFRELSREKTESPVADGSQSAPPTERSPSQNVGMKESDVPSTPTVHSLAKGVATRNVEASQIDAPFTRGSIQTLDIDSDDSDTEINGSSGGTTSSSMEYLAELGFAGLLEGTYVYALGSSVVRGKCQCGAFDGLPEVKMAAERNGLCDSCLRRKEGKHLVSTVCDLISDNIYCKTDGQLYIFHMSYNVIVSRDINWIMFIFVFRFLLLFGAL